ncbi:alpha/beta hydrolase [Sphingomonas mali]|uniref:alpha/beta hydrolase n=1 Tax=Sphingomonas mali TaxID=40682 RepID=UPI001FDF99C8|nr:alpha/beta fold hydrolase [Sphingomonas mali]
MLVTLAVAALTFVTPSSSPEPRAFKLVDRGEPTLLVRHLKGRGPAILFVHGATFPSALSVAFRIDGKSWMDDLHRRGFDVWAFDFAGYGGSERDAAFANDDPAAKPYGAAEAAERQISRVVGAIERSAHRRHVLLLAHSWGTIPAGLFAEHHPDQLAGLVLFGPIMRRGSAPTPTVRGAATLVTAQDQLDSFSANTPAHRPDMDLAVYARWIAAYMATDPASAIRTPPAVRVPNGPVLDILSARAGSLPYDPGKIRVPTMIVRGDRDAVTTSDDLANLARALTSVPGGPEVATLPGGGHRMQLEHSRATLFEAVGRFFASLGHQS